MSLQRIDSEKVDLSWIHRRVLTKDLAELQTKNPDQWDGYINNKTRSLRYVN